MKLLRRFAWRLRIPDVPRLRECGCPLCNANAARGGERLILNEDL